MKWESSSDILSVVSGRSCFYLRVKGVLPTDAVRKNDNWRVLCHRKPRPLCSFAGATFHRCTGRFSTETRNFILRVSVMQCCFAGEIFGINSSTKNPAQICVCHP